MKLIQISPPETYKPGIIHTMKGALFLAVVGIMMMVAIFPELSRPKTRLSVNERTSALKL
ncbi:hypothetical protein MAR_031406 [Mya arenaria]|uniref:NADH dehydrogenase subunit 6 n=1 Tax=Mya arenaria TaxID=6604 RepID=A0ABY7F727_MYAAR|nr:hypothetical protein MAR_031406 [Mya arenaria]